MLANETVAQHFYWLQTPFLYRTHGTPDQDKMRSAGGLCARSGLFHEESARRRSIRRSCRSFWNRRKGTPEENLIGRLTLRSMKRARYTTQPAKGHFGLASRYYCHFTSPIRRYPDLQIHRIIKGTAFRPAGRRTHRPIMSPSWRLWRSQTSRAERRADEAEREVRED